MRPVDSRSPISRIEPLRTGAFRLDGGGMFGLIPKTMWSQWTEADAHNRIALATRSPSSPSIRATSRMSCSRTSTSTTPPA